MLLVLPIIGGSPLTPISGSAARAETTLASTTKRHDHRVTIDHDRTLTLYGLYQIGEV
jgi:hypothetical protein